MKTNYNPMAGGLMILGALVAMLGVPMLVGHFALQREAAPIIQASAANARQ